MASRAALSKVVALCKRRGFVVPSAEIHGGLASSFDYGPHGTLLKRKLEASWWQAFVREQPAVSALDTAVVTPMAVWECSGHVHNFTDPLVDCKRCQKRFRADHLLEEKDGDGDDDNDNDDDDDVEKDVQASDAETGAVREQLAARACPCGKLERWGEQVSDVREFNLMMRTPLGPVAGGAEGVLRPETAQGAYMNFESVRSAVFGKLPFGVAQVGKAFRNEVTLGNFIFRTREFEQMELQWFCHADEADAWFEHWLSLGHAWLLQTVGLDPARLRLAAHKDEDLAHYALRTTDVEYDFPSFGWGELWGFANRGTHDLSCHGLDYRDPHSGERFVPTVVEPALGLNRLLLAVLVEAFEEETLPDGSARVVMRFKPELAPFTVALLPLIGKDEAQQGVCKDLYSQLARSGWCDPTMDLSGARIGKRYRRQDEIGTPFCVTVDQQTAQDGTVTVRDRDSMEQVRVPAANLPAMSAAALGALFGGAQAC